jgi:hypothetical protein
VVSSPSASGPARARKGEINMDNTHQPSTTTPLQLALAWGFVGIPLVLGVLQTLINSMQLFR